MSAAPTYEQMQQIIAAARSHSLTTAEVLVELRTPCANGCGRPAETEATWRRPSGRMVRDVPLCIDCGKGLQKRFPHILNSLSLRELPAVASLNE